MGGAELQILAPRALRLSPYDFTIIWVWRGAEVQDGLFKIGASDKQFPDSKHNFLDSDGQPASNALDFGPWIDKKIPWEDTHIFAVIAGAFFAAGNALGIKVRWGADWNGNGSTKDQTLMDFGHIEVVI
jgi:peptidoglycan L-alanyl-D-glutamate endopeptidase CwlK